MKMPRFRISSIMVLVAIIGLNCWAILTILDERSPIADRVGIGALPMANILIIVPLVSYPHRGNRRFLWGFEVVGAAAVTLYVALRILHPAGVPFVRYYTRLAADALIRAWGSPWSWTNPRFLVGSIIVSLWVSLPQLAFDLIGGFLTRHLRIR